MYLYYPMLSAELSLFIGGMCLNFFTIPTVLDDTAVVPRKQSIPTVISLVVFFIIPYSTLGLYLPSLGALIGAFMWGIIAVYRSQPSIQPLSHDESE